MLSDAVATSRTEGHSDAQPANPAHVASGEGKLSTKFASDWKLVYHALRLLSVWVLGAFYADVRVVNEASANVPERGAIVLTPNHPNEILDIAVLAATIPHGRTIAFWTKAALFGNPVLRVILRSSGAIPVSRSAITSSLSGPSGSSTSKPSASSLPHVLKEDASPQDESKFKAILSHSPKRKSLYSETLAALAPTGRKDGDYSRTLAVFPEGTSCTVPCIIQAKPGAARVTLEYVKDELLRRAILERARQNSAGDSADFGVNLVPVGIIYRDKMRYRSRVHVHYGSPIPLQRYVALYLLEESNDSVSAHEAVRQLTDEILRRMRDLTLAAPDWETLFAAEMSQDMLWDDDGNDILNLNLFLPEERYVEAMQTLIKIFGKSARDGDDDRKLSELQLSLLRYHALLHHTGVTHAALSHVPIPFWSPITSSFSSSSSGSEIQIVGEPHTILPSVNLLVSYGLLTLPSLLISLPAHLSNAPGIILARAALCSFRRLIHEEPEAVAQVSATIGWAGRVIGCTYAGWLCAFQVKETEIIKKFLFALRRSCASIGFSFFISAGSWLERAMPLAGTWLFARLLWLWYETVIDATDLVYFRRLCASTLVLRAILSERLRSRMSKKPTPIFVPAQYLRTPVPVPNPFLPLDVQLAFQRTENHYGEKANGKPNGDAKESISSDRRAANKFEDPQQRMSRADLVIPLFLARAEATARLRECFQPGSTFNERLKASMA